MTSTPSFSDPILQSLLERVETEIAPIPAFSPPPPEKYFQELCESIMSQQLSEKVAPKIIERVKIAVDGNFSPQQVLATPHETLRAAGLSNAKAQYIRNVAEAWESGAVDSAALNTMSDEEVIEHLVQIKGIGRWTAEMFLMFTLGRPDIFSAGDYGLRRAVLLAYGLPETTRTAQILELSEKWQPNRTLACRILWRSLDLPKKIEASDERKA